MAIGLAYQRAGVVGRPVRLAPRPVSLAGREDLLAQVDALLVGDDGPGPRTVALCGLAGAGKTSVAAEYAYRHLAEVGLAWLLAAEDPTVLAAGFGELAAQLGAQDVLVRRDPVTSVHGVLAAFPARWLVVFDNAPDRASVQAFLPPAGNGRVLITSQSSLWPPGQALDVPVLDTEVAAEFLAVRSGDPDRRAAADLAGELGGLPLALEQAAAYVQASGDGLAGYLVLFRRRRSDLLRRGEPGGYGKTVVTTWALAFGRLEQSAPGAVGLLRLLACCAPDAVPLNLLLRPWAGLDGELGSQVAAVLLPLLEDELAARDAIAALRRYSLISPPAGGLVSVHRLVQAVTLDQMPAELALQWRQAAAALIGAALPDDGGQPDAWPEFAALLPHAQAALTDVSAGMERIADYLGYSGSYRAARELAQRMLAGRTRIRGPEHPDTLAARKSLARWTGRAGNPAAARDQYAALLSDSERVLGPEHPDTLAARKSLARWTGDAGDPAAARDQLTALLPVSERVLGPESLDTLSVRRNLAYWTGDAGDPAGARDQYAALLPVEERVLGPESLETLAGRGMLAYWTGDAGDPAGARDQLAALLPDSERVLGPEHPDTLTARASLARWTGFGRRRGRGPRPVRRAAADSRAGPRRRAPADPDHPAEPR